MLPTRTTANMDVDSTAVITSISMSEKCKRTTEKVKSKNASHKQSHRDERDPSSLRCDGRRIGKVKQDCDCSNTDPQRYERSCSQSTGDPNPALVSTIGAEQVRIKWILENHRFFPSNCRRKTISHPSNISKNIPRRAAAMVKRVRNTSSVIS